MSNIAPPYLTLSDNELEKWTDFLLIDQAI